MTKLERQQHDRYLEVMSVVNGLRSLLGSLLPDKHVDDIVGAASGAAKCACSALDDGEQVSE